MPSVRPAERAPNLLAIVYDFAEARALGGPKSRSTYYAFARRGLLRLVRVGGGVRVDGNSLRALLRGEAAA